MIRLYSTEQALSLRGAIPELAVIRSLQFQGDGYSSEEHGHIIVVQEGDDITQIEEIGTNGLFDDDELPAHEFADAFRDGDKVVFEVVFQIDNSRTIAVIIPDEPWLDTHLKTVLKQASPSPQPLPQIERTMP